MQAFKLGLAPVVVGLMVAIGWVLAQAVGGGPHGPLFGAGPWLLAVATALLVWRGRLRLLWLLVAGTTLGTAGLV